MNSFNGKNERSKFIGLMLCDLVRSKDILLLQRLLSKLSAEEINEGSLPYNYTALHIAAGDGDVEVVAEFLKKTDINLNVRGEDGYTPVMVAAWACNVQVVKLLLKYPKVDLDYVDKLGRTIEDLVGEGSKTQSIFDIEKIKKMIKIGRDNDDRIGRRIWSMSTHRMLCDSIRTYDWDGVMQGFEFIKTNDLNKQDMNGYTPLHWACIKNREDIVKILLGDEDVDVNAVDEQGLTPVIRAAWLCQTDCLKLLLEDHRVDILNKEAEFAFWTGKAMICTNKQKIKTTEIVNKEISRRRTELTKNSSSLSKKLPRDNEDLKDFKINEDLEHAKKEDNPKNRTCLYHLQLRKYIEQMEEGK